MKEWENQLKEKNRIQVVEKAGEQLFRGTSAKNQGIVDEFKTPGQNDGFKGQKGFSE